MDVQMPQQDGVSATAAIRQGEIGTSRHIPIVAMTAHVQPSECIRCLEAGMDDFLTKPVDRRQLDGILAGLCGGELPQSTAAAAHAVPPEILDSQEVSRLLDGDWQAIGELIDVFVEEADKLMVRILSAVDAGNAEELYLAAHMLNGSAANLYARQTQQAARALEVIAKDRRLDEVPAGLANVEAALDRLRPALAAMRKFAQA